MTIVIDVREPNEYAGGHACGAVNLPLSCFDVVTVAELCRAGAVELVCKSGMRANEAKDRLLAEFPDLADKVTAGVGEAEVAQKSPAIPIIRQVMIAAGSLVLGFGLAAALGDPRWAWGDVVMGGGLLFAGTTGFCGMAKLLQLMPWNRA